MPLRKVAGYRWIRKEKSENRTIWGEGRRVRSRMNGVGEEADCGWSRKQKSEHGRLWVEGEGEGRR